MTLGELFDDAGPARDVVVAAAHRATAWCWTPRAVQAFARRYGLDWANPQRHPPHHRAAADAGRPSAAGRTSREILTYARSLDRRRDRPGLRT